MSRQLKQAALPCRLSGEHVRRRYKYAAAVDAVVAAAKDVYRQYVPIGLSPLMDAVSRLAAIERAAAARQTEERKQQEPA